MWVASSTNSGKRESAENDEGKGAMKLYKCYAVDVRNTAFG